MSAEPAPEFVDANILVYAFDASAGEKKRAAEQLIARLWETENGCLSVQVLQEFFVTVTGKVARRLPTGDAAERVRELASGKVFAPTAGDVLAARSGSGPISVPVNFNLPTTSCGSSRTGTTRTRWSSKDREPVPT